MIYTVKTLHKNGNAFIKSQIEVENSWDIIQITHKIALKDKTIESMYVYKPSNLSWHDFGWSRKWNMKMERGGNLKFLRSNQLS